MNSVVIHKLYQYDEANNIVLDLYSEGYIPYDVYNKKIVFRKGLNEKIVTGKEMLEEALKNILVNVSSNDYDGVVTAEKN